MPTSIFLPACAVRKFWPMTQIPAQSGTVISDSTNNTCTATHEDY
jgi:hypothetical protein